MRLLPSADGSSGSAEPEPGEELAERMRTNGAGARLLCARSLSLSGLRGPNAQYGAALAAERR
jgi:hypothetical protein